MAVSDVVATWLSSPTEPMKLLVSGGVGTGKTTTLAEIRAALRAGGVTVVARPLGLVTRRTRRWSSTTPTCWVPRIWSGWPS